MDFSDSSSLSSLENVVYESLCAQLGYTTTTTTQQPIEPVQQSAHQQYIEITLGSDIRVFFPAGALAQQGTQAILNQLVAQYPPQQVSMQSALNTTTVSSSTSTNESSEPDDRFNTFVNHQVIEPTSSQLAAAANQQSTAAAPHPTYTKSTAAPRRARTANRRHPRRKTPPGFPGYRTVAQHVGLRAADHRPLVRLGEIYEFMARTWPDWFSMDKPGAGLAWQSGVRHACAKHFVRVPRCQAPAGSGVWYKVDVGNLV